MKIKICESSVMENVARIAADYMGRLVDLLSDKYDSAAIIHGYVIPWAYEAERKDQRTWEVRFAKGDYLDWLDAFVEGKIKELEDENGND